MTPETAVAFPARARRVPAAAFPIALLALGAIAIAELRAPARIVTGLPHGPGIAAIDASVHDRLGVETGGLRLHSTLLGTGGTPDVALAVSAARRLRAEPAPWPDDPRRLSAIAALELAAHRPVEAERLYRQAVDRAAGYGEARQGLGVALALRAETEGGAERARGLRLRAISQFAAVAEGDPAYEAALHGRALLLARVGRAAEARRWADEYLARDARSEWAEALRRTIDAAPR